MPLKSLKVLDFSTLLPGPYATMMLADMGADVLRVEAPKRSDLTRMLPPLDESGTSYIHRTLNRNKRSIGLDLKQPEAVSIIHKLVAEYDIVVEQFRPGVMKKLGLDYATLQAINPKLIYCSITGYGQTGPFRDRAGHDINYLATAGMSSYTGTQQHGPIPAGFQIADVAGGSMHAVSAILAAVIERQQSGEGQYIDVSMTDAAFALNAMSGAAAMASDRDPLLQKEVLNGGTFYNYYRTSDDRYLSVGSLEPQFLQQLCEAIGRPELVASGLRYTPEAQAPLIQALEDAISQQPLSHWQAVFANLDACVEPVLTVLEAGQHPQLQAREMLVEVESEDGSALCQIAHPIKYSRYQPQYKHAGCELGEHNTEVLSELAISPEDIERLSKQGVTG